MYSEVVLDFRFGHVPEPRLFVKIMMSGSLAGDDEDIICYNDLIGSYWTGEGEAAC